MNEQSTGSEADSTPPVPGSTSSTAPSVPKYKLYDRVSVTIATVLGSPVGGTGLLALNYHRMGKSRSALLTFAIGVAATAGGVGLGFVVPSYATEAITVGLMVATMSAARTLQGATIEEHVRRGGALSSRWAASGLGLVCLAVVFGALYSFYLATQPAREVFYASRDNVYYSGAATRNDAQALAAALKRCGYFRDMGFSVFLSKEKAGTAVSFVVDGGAWRQPDIIAGFEEVGREVAPSVGGYPITLRLVDPHDKTLRKFAIGRTLMGSKDELYYYGTATLADATALGQSLKVSGFLQDKGVTVFLSKGAGETAVSFVMADGAWKEPENVAGLTVLVQHAANSIGGFPIQMRLLNTALKLEKVVEVIH